MTHQVTFDFTMSNSPDHQTSAFINENGENFADATQPDATSGGRLLSTSEDHKGIRMTRPAKRRLWLIIAILLILLILIAAIVIIAVAASAGSSSEQDDNQQEETHYKPHKVPHLHVRCLNDVIVAKNDSRAHWRHYDSTTRAWKTIPQMHNVGFVLISPRFKLEAGYPGIMVSMLLPRNNTHFHFMAVSSKDHHSDPVAMASSPDTCESVILDDPDFFDGNEKEFRIYVYYKTHIRFHDLKFTVTSLPLAPRFESLSVRKEMSTRPDFAVVDGGNRDVCSVEIKDNERRCNWWNVHDGDNADFVATESSSGGCIDGGVRSTTGDVWFLALESRDDHHESRALLLSPIIQRKTESVLLTLWYMFKCEGPHLRIHLIPAGKSSFRHALSTSSVVADVTEAASHSDWKFLSFQIPLPETNKAYQIALEGVVPRKGNCTFYNCIPDSTSEPKQAEAPQIGLDGLSVELLHKQCKPKNESSVMDCRFQTDANEPTRCEWDSSTPPGVSKEFLRIFPNMFDWTAVNSGDGDDHGATAQHFEGRGYIMTFDASGRAATESYVRTPLLRANDNCTCFMTFLYLMRGLLAPRMQVNVVYGRDTSDNSRPSEPQWSLFGHQSHDWRTAKIPLNLKTDLPFQIEIRVLDIYDSLGDVHFDDLLFSGCDMEKYTPA